MEKSNDCDKNINTLLSLIRDENQLFQQHSKKGILVLGESGAGKSTLIHALSGRKLLSTLDKDTAELVIDTVEFLEDIVISHEPSSDRKIPHNCLVGGILIWEFPGFEDNDPVEKVAFYFYTRKLFEITGQLKLVLVVPEKDLTEMRGSRFLKTLTSFIEMFKDIKCIEGTMSLVVTKVNKRRGNEHIRKTIENTLAHNQSVTDMHKLLISQIVSSLYLFHQPNENAVVELPGLVKYIDTSIKFLAVNGDMAKFGLSKDSETYVNHLLDTTCHNFNKLVEIIAKAISDATKCLNVNAFNVFSENHSQIKCWISASALYKNHEEIRYYFFPELELLTKLQNALQNPQVSNVSDGIKILQQVLEIVFRYVEPSSDLCHQIQDYGFCLEQLYELVTLISSAFGVVHKIDCSMICELIKYCQGKTEENLEYAFIHLRISENKSNESYYRRAIQLLKKHQKFPNCLKQLALAYRCLGVIVQSKDDSVALNYFLKSIAVDEEQPQIYSKIGKLFTKVGQYGKAVKCYATLNSKLQKMVKESK